MGNKLGTKAGLSQCIWEAYSRVALKARVPRASTEAPLMPDVSSQVTFTSDGKAGSSSSSSGSCVETSREPMASSVANPTLVGIAGWKARAPKRLLETASARLALHGSGEKNGALRPFASLERFGG